MFNSVVGWRTLSTYLIIMIIITIVHNVVGIEYTVYTNEFYKNVNEKHVTL